MLLLGLRMHHNSRSNSDLSSPMVGGGLGEDWTDPSEPKNLASGSAVDEPFCFFLIVTT